MIQFSWKHNSCIETDVFIYTVKNKIYKTLNFFSSWIITLLIIKDKYIPVDLQLMAHPHTFQNFTKIFVVMFTGKHVKMQKFIVTMYKYYVYIANFQYIYFDIRNQLCSATKTFFRTVLNKRCPRVNNVIKNVFHDPRIRG